MRKKTLVAFFVLLSVGLMAFGQEESGEKQKEQIPQEEALMGLGVFVGYWGTWIEGFKDIYGTKGGLTWGAELGFNIKDNIYGVMRYTYFFEPHEQSELNFTQNVFNCGIRYSVIGAGITYTTLKLISSSSGIGFYAELILPIDKHLFAGIKADFVNIDNAKAGGICYCAGYSF